MSFYSEITKKSYETEEKMKLAEKNYLENQEIIRRLNEENLKRASQTGAAAEKSREELLKREKEKDEFWLQLGRSPMGGWKF